VKNFLHQIEMPYWQNFPTVRWSEIPQSPFPQQIIEEAEEDLNAFVAVLEKLGITVKRPETWPHEARFSTTHWESEGYYDFCPRDILLEIGDHVIETPSVIRSRAQSIGSEWIDMNLFSVNPDWVVADKE
jgi:hypothetical protein